MSTRPTWYDPASGHHPVLTGLLVSGRGWVGFGTATACLITLTAVVPARARSQATGRRWRDYGLGQAAGLLPVLRPGRPLFDDAKVLGTASLFTPLSGQGRLRRSCTGRPGAGQVTTPRCARPGCRIAPEEGEGNVTSSRHRHGER